jgi:hypothetical protein
MLLQPCSHTSWNKVAPSGCSYVILRVLSAILSIHRSNKEWTNRSANCERPNSILYYQISILYYNGYFNVEIQRCKIVKYLGNKLINIWAVIILHRRNVQNVGWFRIKLNNLMFVICYSDCADHTGVSLLCRPTTPECRTKWKVEIKHAVRHIFQLARCGCDTRSNITNLIFTWAHNTTHKNKQCSNVLPVYTFGYFHLQDQWVTTHIAGAPHLNFPPCFLPPAPGHSENSGPSSTTTRWLGQ